MAENNRLRLQLFAEGGEGGAPAAAEGEASGASGRIRGKRQRAQGENSFTLQPAGPVAGAETMQEGAAGRMSWDEVKADPEYSRHIQSLVQNRLKNSKEAEEKLRKMAPAMEQLAQQYGLDAAAPDFYDSLSRAIGEKKAAPERSAAQESGQEQERIKNYIGNLMQQAEEMKKTFPNFDIRRELENPRFRRLTSPAVGLSLEDAYFALHRDEIQAAAMQVTAQKTAQRISSSILAGQLRPSENGTGGSAACVSSFDYSKASPRQREEIKKQIRAAAARGEKIYP